MKFGTQQQIRPQGQSHDQMLIIFKFKMADGRHVGKYWTRHIDRMDRISTKLGGSYPTKLN